VRPLFLRVALATALGTLALGAHAAHDVGAEQVGGGGVVASFNGWLSPKRLPRHHPVPVSVTLEGSIRADGDGAPPRLGRLDVDFGVLGGLETEGLPLCPLARLRNATVQQALDRCRSALLGRGTIVAEVPLNPAEPLPARATALAFNGRTGGRSAVWILAYSASPPVSFVLPFHLRRLRGGAFGIEISSPVARALGRWPRLRSFRFTLGRRYRAGGSARTYLSAACSLPARLHVGFVAFARATYRFVSGPTHRVTILRGCRVRG
jgi:hypothetical protein